MALKKRIPSKICILSCFVWLKSVLFSLFCLLLCLCLFFRLSLYVAVSYTTRCNLVELHASERHIPADVTPVIYVWAGRSILLLPGIIPMSYLLTLWLSDATWRNADGGYVLLANIVTFHLDLTPVNILHTDTHSDTHRHTHTHTHTHTPTRTRTHTHTHTHA